MLTSFFILMTGWIVGTIVVASNPSPYFAALGLVFVAAVGGSALVVYGGAYLWFVLLFAYMGGMMVVFAFTSAMAADPYPATLGTSQVLNGMVAYLFFVVSAGFIYFSGEAGKPSSPSFEDDPMAMFRGDTEGITFVFWAGGCVLMICGWGLLLTLIIVLQLVEAVMRRSMGEPKK